jgi:hypothetical protein
MFLVRSSSFLVQTAFFSGLPDSPGMEARSDEELIAEYLLAPASDRSRQSLDELFRRHRSRVIAWCYRLTSNRDLAPDLAQDVFVKAYSSLDMFRDDCKFTTWLYIITRVHASPWRHALALTRLVYVADSGKGRQLFLRNLDQHDPTPIP